MSERDRDRSGTEPRRGRFRKRAVLLGLLAAAIYVGYLAFMIISGSEA